MLKKPGDLRVFLERQRILSVLPVYTLKLTNYQLEACTFPTGKQIVLLDNSREVRARYGPGSRYGPPAG